MKELLSKLNTVRSIAQELEPNMEDRDQLIQKTHAFCSSFIENIDKNKSYVLDQSMSDKLSITGDKKSLESLLDMYQTEVIQKGINPASGGHVGYIPGGGLYASALGDYIADISNEYAGMFFGSPGAVQIEHEVLDWLKGVFQFPKNSVGNLTSGGSIANLIALTSARDKHKIKGAKIEKSVIYLSEQVHHCIQKAIKIIGLEDIIIRYIELDEFHRMKISAIEAQIESDKKAGLNPFLLIASAGTTDTGAVDPLKDLGEIAKQENMWYHVDGAYGGFFILVEDHREKFNGIEMADSLVIDPHKGLFLPYGVGAVLVKDIEAVFHSHHCTANYMQDTMIEGLPANPADVSPELTKHFRGLRVWLPLQLHGIKPFIACLEEKILLTQYFRNRLKDIGFELGPEPDLSVSYFWYPREKEENQFNEKLMERIHQDGSVFLSSTSLKGKFVIRMAILSFRTTKQTIDRAMDMIERALGELGVES